VVEQAHMRVYVNVHNIKPTYELTLKSSFVLLGPSCIPLINLDNRYDCLLKLTLIQSSVS